MAGPELKFVIGAVDNASKVFSNIGKETEKLGGATAKLNAASRLLGAGAIIAFGAASVKAYAEAETQQVKLQEAYRKFPAIANVSIQSMRDLNTAIQAKTGTDDDELAAAEAKLAMYNLTGTQIQQLIPLVNDYAVATGQNVGDAAQTLGKAMMGNARALKALGIDFHATGDSAKDFQTIYDALQGKVGGAGDAFGQTTAGQLKILQKSFEDLQEEVGAQLVPALQGLVTVAKPLLGAFGGMPPIVKGVVVWVGAAAAAALVLGPRLLMLTASLKALMPAGVEAAAGIEAESAAAATAATTNEAAAVATKGMVASFAGVAGAVTAAVAVIGALGEANKALQDHMGNGAKTMEQWGDVSRISGRDMVQLQMDLAGVANTAGSVSGALKYMMSGDVIGAWTAWRTGSENVTNFDAALAGMVSSGNTAQAAALVKDLGLSSEDVSAKLPQYAKALSDAGVAADGMSSSGQGVIGTLDGMSQSEQEAASAASTHEEALKRLKAAMDALGHKAVSIDKANSDLYESYDKAAEAAAKATDKTNANTDAVDANRTHLDLLTPAGRAVQESLAGIRDKSIQMRDAYRQAGASTAQIVAKQQEAYNAFVAAAKSAGLSDSAARGLAKAYGMVPRDVETAIKATGVDAAVDAAQRIRGAIVSIPRTWDVTVTVVGQNGNNIRVPNLTGGATGGYFMNGRFHYDTGGAVFGPGTGTSDSIPAMLSNGEYVLRAAAVSKLGLGLLDDLNDNGQLDTHKFSTGGRVHLAAGGSPAQKLANLIRDTGRLTAASTVLADLVKARNEMASSITGSIAGTGGLFNAFDVKALPNALQSQAQAVDQLAAAQKSLADANRQVNLAGTPAERATALEAQAKAQADLAKATQDKAAADRAVAAAQPTGANVLAGLRSKLGSIKGFFNDVVALKKRGLSAHLLKQLVDAGPVDGADMAKALMQATPSELKDIVTTDVAIARTSAQLGSFTADVVNGPLITRQRAVVDRAAAAARADAVLVSQVRLSLDSKTVAEALVQYRKAMGGRPLGIG